MLSMPVGGTAPVLLRLKSLNFSTAKEALQDLLRGFPLASLEQEVCECLCAEPNCTILKCSATLDGGPDLVGLGNLTLVLEPPDLLCSLASLLSVALPPALGLRFCSGAVGNVEGRREGVSGACITSAVEGTTP